MGRLQVAECRLDQVGRIQNDDHDAGAQDGCASDVTHARERGAEGFDDELGFVDQPVSENRDRAIALRQHEK